VACTKANRIEKYDALDLVVTLSSEHDADATGTSVGKQKASCMAQTVMVQCTVVALNIEPR
jgi:hypothetical protein